MEYGRCISPQDIEILEELQTYWKDKVKIDFDIVHEPCIFYNYFGSWNIVYKLSKNGLYIEKKTVYVTNAHNAILSFLNEQKRIKYEEERKFQDNFNKKRNQIQTKGFQDDFKGE